ncbi:unnamed protein product [Euphydryas editha]|uniref:Uncharacterized protein n=1 Tax=Euphydryas editha TaxID=104508 RepID=A0AAU9UTI1_EUPED|nr:unnamed protein product [Euphydryas editha]
MGRKALIAVLCWLTLTQTSAKAVQTAYGVGIIDNISAESAPRLYSNVPVGVYASATPYAAYSFHTPTFIATKNSQVIPVKEESVFVQNTNGFLKDSYGQRFVEAPQTLAYKATFPQQFVQLQNLPAHLSQPLVASPNFQYGQTPHFFGQTQFGVPHLQTLAPSALRQYTSQPTIYANNVRSFAPSGSISSQTQGISSTQQQPSSNKNAYVSSLTADHFNKLQNEPKIASAASNNNNKQSQSFNAQKNKLQLVQAPKQTSITTVTNGKKTVVNLITKPSLPLLDLTLLEPLTFKNPLVPQVQHFLPRINQVTYKKLPEINEVKKHEMEFVVQNTKSYDSGLMKDKPKNEVPKKRLKNQPSQTNYRNEEDVHPTPSVTIHEDHNEHPENSYDINTPTYRETYSEEKTSYNKETESDPVNISYEKQTQKEPVHYSYEERTEKKPIHYSFTHTSNQPAQIKQVYFENNEKPKQLIYHFKNEENKQHQPSSSQRESEESQEEHSEENDKEEDQPHFEQDNGRQEYYDNAPKIYHGRPEHREQTYYYNLNDGPAEIRHSQGVSNKPPRQNVENHIQANNPEYEEAITILPAPKSHSPIHDKQHQNRHFSTKHNHHPGPQNQQRHYEYSNPHHYSPLPVVREKSERIIIKEGSTSEVHKPNEELMAEMLKKQEETEEDFEKAYKDAAFGFPAFDAPSVDIEKEIYNPESYGASRYYKDFNIEKTPLREYEADGDEYPKQTRSQYKDARDKTMDEYFLDYAVSRPESLVDRYKNKEDYYKIYTHNKPNKYFGSKNEDKNQKPKYTFSYGYNAKPKQKQQSKYRAVPQFEEYDYDKEAPRDNSAYSTRPYQQYKSKTQFVEPQYQYGFEPSSLPNLLDSELASMASNVKPKSEKLESKKKIYKTNWYVKKASTNGGKVNS